jgi:hypothetical protein
MTADRILAFHPGTSGATLSRVDAGPKHRAAPGTGGVLGLKPLVRVRGLVRRWFHGDRDRPSVGELDQITDADAIELFRILYLHRDLMTLRTL